MAGIFEIKTTAAGKYHFVLKAANGEVILSSQQYATKVTAEKGVDSVRRNAEKDKQYERKTAKSGEPYFVLKAANGQVIGQSEMYTADAGVESGIASVKRNAPNAKLKDLTAPRAKSKSKAPAASVRPAEAVK